jgi:pimeloyl-ACP methyl ester carboxylesterase
MRSGRGFVTDLSYAGTDHRQTRRFAHQRVTCPTLITASRHDRGVTWAHVEALAATIPLARLEELPAPSQPRHDRNDGPRTSITGASYVEDF